ncbi:hypothetical protein VUR80DRAFT_2427 [Thermomyces stellatus]
MMTSTRPNEAGGSFANRRGHAPKLSISDPSHHVTETIGTLYDTEEEETAQESSQKPASNRPLSFMPSSNAEELIRTADTTSDGRPHLDRSTSDSGGLTNPPPASLKKVQTSPARIPTIQNGTQKEPSPTSPISPTLSLKDVQDDPGTSQFPLGNIEKPSDIAQELSNLQALRRMSMDVGNNNDPDMLPFSGLSLMPSIAPTGDDDEADPNRLLWVPARVHPELAPSEFKNFLETRVKSIKRRSGDPLLQAEDGLNRSDSGGLSRRKSMLSRQVDTSGNDGKGYVDGADSLERQRSQSGRRESKLTLDELVKEPHRVVQKLAEESKLQEGQINEDMPILPIAPGAGLRRSTRTTYRKGGSLRGAALSKRIASRQAESKSNDKSETEQLDAPKAQGLTRTQSEPTSENFSRPNKPLRKPQKLSQGSNTLSDAAITEPPSKDPDGITKASHRSFHIDGSGPVPQLGDVVTPSSQEDSSESRPFPQRSSSQKATEQMVHQVETPQPQQQPPTDQPPPQSRKRHGVSGRLSQSSPSQQEVQPKQTGATTAEAGLNSGHVPVDGRDSSTDSLTYIPTFTSEDKRPDRRTRKDDDASSTTSSKSGWNSWFKSGVGEKKKKDDERKSKTKGLVERAHDNVRLDVLQTSIGKTVSKGKESLMPDREVETIEHKPQEERKKEPHRKSNSKKEKDGNFLSSLFSGGRRKSDKESGTKKGHARQVSEEPTYRPLRPNIDYPYSRFSVLEERAIYRMAHIKLANPRRPLQSQVLLSNFMYNYLAIVQAEHPQMQFPTSPQQKRLEEERRREEEQQYLAEQQMQQGAGGDSIDRYTFDYHRDANQAQYGEHAADESVDYMDDTHLYEYDERREHEGNLRSGNGYEGYESENDYRHFGQQQQQRVSSEGLRERDDMW